MAPRTFYHKKPGRTLISETKNIIFTILASTSIFLFAQTGAPDQAYSSSILSAFQTSESYAILLFAIWSLVFSIGGWCFFVDQETLGLKKFVIKNSFAVYILFIASIILSIFFLIYMLTNI